jgi:hypothetical protein
MPMAATLALRKKDRVLSENLMAQVFGQVSAIGIPTAWLTLVGSTGFYTEVNAFALPSLLA